jgi:hypothetical protein
MQLTIRLGIRKIVHMINYHQAMLFMFLNFHDT